MHLFRIESMDQSWASYFVSLTALVSYFKCKSASFFFPSLSFSLFLPISIPPVFSIYDSVFYLWRNSLSSLPHVFSLDRFRYTIFMSSEQPMGLILQTEKVDKELGDPKLYYIYSLLMSIKLSSSLQGSMGLSSSSALGRDAGEVQTVQTPPLSCAHS